VPDDRSSAGSSDSTSAGDHVLAVAAAWAAADVLMALRAERPARDRERLASDGDRRAHETITRLLGHERPGDPVLSEEAADHPDLDRHGRLWIVDPLDGTREFSEGRADFAVHVALVVAGVPVVGAVALPAEDVVLSTADPVPLATRRDGPPRLVVSRTRPPAVAVRLAHELGGELVPMGSAGAKVMAVVRGDADIYVHAGGQYQWDSAAPVAVALAAGAHATRLDGSPLRYDDPDPWLPDLLVCRPELAATVLVALGR
jgi:3'(2'), 5'-bisphosphate nucleotidase